MSIDAAQDVDRGGFNGKEAFNVVRIWSLATLASTICFGLKHGQAWSGNALILHPNRWYLGSALACLALIVTRPQKSMLTKGYFARVECMMLNPHSREPGRF